MANLYRLHLKTATQGPREELIRYCLNNHVLAIGWSELYDESENISFEEFCERANEKVTLGLYNSFPTAIKYFGLIEKDDIIWTRDTDGFYYICRVKKKVEMCNDKALDIGCVIPVDIIKVDTNVPGKIVSCFCPTRTIQSINDEKLLKFSEYIINRESKKEIYSFETPQYDLFDMLHPLDVEELIIAYIQIKYDYYLSKNSISGRSTTPSIECEFYSKCVDNPKSAVLQVKTGKDSVESQKYENYIANGKKVFLFFANQHYDYANEKITYITKKDILNFVKEYKAVLPSAIKEWIDFCKV